MFGSTKALKDLLQKTESELQPLKDVFNALSKSMAVIEFTTDGIILSSNANFSDVMGYDTEEIRGMHHSRLCPNDYAQSPSYQQFWERLRRGESFGGKFKRIAKSGRTVWLEATYFPVNEPGGKIAKVIKIASDITAAVEDAALTQGLVDAIHRSTAVIEFDLNGNIIDANPNFLKVVGYSLSDLKNQHHSKLCSTEYVQTSEYRTFWERLNSGEYFSGQFQRVAKGGQIIWLEATYNPVLDENERPYRIIKFASDVTHQVLRLQSEQRAVGTAYQISKETEGLSNSGEEIIVQSIGKMRQLESHLSMSSQQVQSLGDKTSQITSIVNTIREIADQTNLLALNAAIEAARAGESGRGFAVVADEVRKLAERTASSTSEIAQMITNIQAESQNVIQSMNQSLSEVQEGAELANSAGSAIQQIREGAHRVVNVVQELSDAIRQ